MSSELIGALMIAVMLLAIFVGFPISFTLIFLGLAFGYWGFGDLVFYLMTLQFNSVMLEQTLAAVPLFVFMGIMMEQAGLMERLFRSVQLMLASTRGSRSSRGGSVTDACTRSGTSCCRSCGPRSRRAACSWASTPSRTSGPSRCCGTTRSRARCLSVTKPGSI